MNEGQNFNLHASVSPPGMYWITGTVNWGSSPGMGSESFSTFTMSDGSSWLPHQYYDDGPSPGNQTPSDVETITVTVGGLVGTTSATIANIAPTGNNFRVTNLVVPDSGRNWRVEGFVQDVMPAGDTLTVTIDWGDGSEPTEFLGLPSYSSIHEEHAYPPNGQTFSVQVTVLDDDNGTWIWSEYVEMYLLDIDNDAYNDGVIAEDDDPIEANSPGAYILVNDNDSDDDQVVDLDQVGPIANESDLGTVEVRFIPSSNSVVDNHLGWYVGLVPNPGPSFDPQTGDLDPKAAILYHNPDKCNPVAYTMTPYGEAVVWEVGQDPLSAALFAEARCLGILSFTLHLMNRWIPGNMTSCAHRGLIHQDSECCGSGITTYCKIGRRRKKSLGAHWSSGADWEAGGMAAV